MYIDHLYLYTDQLAEQTEFYKRVLGLRLVEQLDESSTFRVGRSLLTWRLRPRVRPYHFAFNIFSNQIVEATQWLKGRLKVLSYKGEDIQDFASWRAKAVYFYDAAGNIVEFIARSGVDQHSDHDFSADSILSISEIGMPTDNIESVATVMSEDYGLAIFSGSYDRFCAIGDDHGLFIIIDRNLKKWFPTGEGAFIEDFEIVCSIGHQSYTAAYQNGTFKAKKIISFIIYFFLIFYFSF